MSDYSIALEKQLELDRIASRFGPRIFRAITGSPDMTDEEGQLLTNVLRRSVAGICMYWAKQLIPLLVEGARTIPDWQCSLEDLAPSGFCWLGTSPALPPDSDGYQPPLRAISWTTVVTREPTERIFVFWCGIPEYDYPVPLRMEPWPFGDPLSKLLEAEVPPAVRDFRASCLRYAAAIMAFLVQRIVLPTGERPDRSTRRRISVYTADDLIEVIRLRRTATASARESIGEIEWSCQWIVRGHWRQQWYPKMTRHQPRWIAPYVKGPGDKPLRPPKATVFAVVR